MHAGHVCHLERSHACMDGDGSILGMESVESSRERRPGKRPEQVFERRTWKTSETGLCGS